MRIYLQKYLIKLMYIYTHTYIYIFYKFIATSVINNNMYARFVI